MSYPYDVPSITLCKYYINAAGCGMVNKVSGSHVLVGYKSNRVQSTKLYLIDKAAYIYGDKTRNIFAKKNIAGVRR